MGQTMRRPLVRVLLIHTSSPRMTSWRSLWPRGEHVQIQVLSSLESALPCSLFHWAGLQELGGGDWLLLRIASLVCWPEEDQLPSWLFPVHISICVCVCVKEKCDPMLFFSSAVLHSMWDLSSPSRDWTWASAMQVWSSNHWTARGVPVLMFHFVLFFEKPNLSFICIC